MKILDINQQTAKKIDNVELISLHRRIHQLYISSKDRKVSNSFSKILHRAHSLLVDEMEKRGINHKSNLNEDLEFLDKYLKKMYCEELKVFEVTTTL